jgi:hypothetical protein
VGRAKEVKEGIPEWVESEKIFGKSRKEGGRAEVKKEERGGKQEEARRPFLWVGRFSCLCFAPPVRTS